MMANNGLWRFNIQRISGISTLFLRKAENNREYKIFLTKIFISSIYEKKNIKNINLTNAFIINDIAYYLYYLSINLYKQSYKFFHNSCTLITINKIKINKICYLCLDIINDYNLRMIMEHVSKKINIKIIKSFRI